jgi:uncharacterized protein YkwD
MSASVRLFLTVCCLCVCWTELARSADIVDHVNALRTRGCADSAGAPTKLEQTRALDAVATEWSKGGRLQQAIETTGYRALNSSSMRISGAPNDQAVAKVLARHYCTIVANRAFTDIGVAKRGRDVWLVVATPVEFPSARDANRVANEVLALVNAARAKPRTCGSTSFMPAPALTLSATLTKAALAHAQDMANHDHFEHHGTDGSSPADRATRAGYRWRHVAENIAAGAPTARDVVQGWLDSPGHCANIMGAQYREMGIAYAVNHKSRTGIYWAQTFATAR